MINKIDKIYEIIQWVGEKIFTGKGIREAIQLIITKIHLRYCTKCLSGSSANIY